jgi:hypothetical protein
VHPKAVRHTETKIQAYDRHDHQETIDYFKNSDVRRYRFAGSIRRISAIYERISIEYVAWWSVLLPLTNYNVQIGVSDNAGRSVISRKIDAGFHVHELQNDLT